jgi:sarcosine oxidase subunit beta
MRVIVIGGGLVGCGLAYQLAKRGRPVLLLESRNLVSGASGRNGGMIMKIDGRDSKASEIAKRWPYVCENDRMLDAFQAELQEDIGLWRRGSLDIATSEKEVELLRRLVRMQREELGDGEIRYLDRWALHELSPVLSDLCLGARYRPSDGCLFPLKLAHALAREAVKMGCEVRAWTKVEEIILQGGRVAGVRTAQGLLEAEVVVNAANGWAASLTPQLPIVPLRSLAVITEPAPPVPALTFEAELDSKIVYGCTQTRRGNLLVGGPPEFTATREGQFDEGVSLREMLVNASVIPRMFPRLAALSVIRAWSGAMGITPDGLPCVGRVKPYEGLYVAAGYSNGLSWAPVTSRLLAELIVEGGTSIPLDPLDPERFAGRSYQWPQTYDYTVLADYLGRVG